MKIEFKTRISGKKVKLFKVKNDQIYVPFPVKEIANAKRTQNSTNSNVYMYVLCNWIIKNVDKTLKHSLNTKAITQVR